MKAQSDRQTAYYDSTRMSTSTLHSSFILAMMVSDHLFAMVIVTVGKVPSVPVASDNEGGRVGHRTGLEALKKIKTSGYKSIHYSLSSSLWSSQYTNYAILYKIKLIKVRKNCYKYKIMRR
jgi:hypothetical protein